MIVHTKLTGDVMYMSSPLALHEIVENRLPFALQQAWNKKAFKMKRELGQMVNVNDFLQYLYKHIELLSTAFAPSTFKTFRPPKETPGSWKNTGSYSLQRSESKPVFSPATEVIRERTQGA